MIVMANSLIDKVKLAALTAALIINAGCVSSGYKKPTTAFLGSYEKQAAAEIALETRKKALEHMAYDFIPFQREQMHFCDPRHIIWYLFGNDDDGIFGEGQSTEKPYSENISCLTHIKWNYLRNFGHNMKYYPPLGSACFDKHWNWSIFTWDSGGARVCKRDYTGVFADGKNSFKINFNDLKPFISLKAGKFETYFGWREKGNFGASLRFHKKKAGEK